MEKALRYSAVILLIIAAVWFGSWNFPQTVVDVVHDTLTTTVVDYVYQDPITVRDTVKIRDTLYIFNDDTVATGVASMDTVFADSSRIAIDYFIEPKVFEVDYLPAPVKIIENTVTVTNTVYIDSSAWWDKAWIGASGALLLIIAIK